MTTTNPKREAADAFQAETGMNGAQMLDCLLNRYGAAEVVQQIAAVVGWNTRYVAPEKVDRYGKAVQKLVEAVEILEQLRRESTDLEDEIA